MPINDSSALKYPYEPEEFEGPETLGKFVSIELPDEAVEILNELIPVTGDTVESLFRRSLGLYTIAYDVKRKGRKLAIVDAETGEFVQDIPGL